MNISIKPVPCFPSTATMLVVDDGHVQLGSTANFQWHLLSDDNVVVSGPERCALTQKQYAAWGDDDSDVVRFIAENIGVVPAAAVASIEAAPPPESIGVV